MGFLTLKDHVYDYIVDQINSGNLKPGEKINEKDICKQLNIKKALNISRTPVRETLIQLSSEGIVENIPRKGFMIKKIGIEEIKETYRVLGALDGLAAALSCPHITEKEISDMEAYVKCIDDAIRSEDYLRYYKQQLLFHDVYTLICGNKTLIDTIHTLKNKFLYRTYRSPKLDNIKEILANTNNEHKEMIRLFRKKDAKDLEEYTKNVHWSLDKANFEIV